jgi:hypothetical protein
VQVTYNGYSLYRFSGDTRSGDVNGEAFASKWFAVGPTGSLVKAPAGGNTGSAGGTSSGGTTTSSSSGGYGY